MTRLQWFQTAPLADVFEALAEDGSLLLSLQSELAEAQATITALSPQRFSPNELALIASVFSDSATEAAESEDVDKVAEAPMLRALARKAGLAVPVGHVVTFNQENLDAALTVAREELEAKEDRCQKVTYQLLVARERIRQLEQGNND